MTADPETPSRWSWFDRWLQPRWRALLTWVVLALIMGMALDAGLESYLRESVDSSVTKVNSLVPGWVTSAHSSLVLIVNFVSLVTWYQPLLLRVGLLRWVIWMGGAAATAAGFSFYAWSLGPWEAAIFFWAWPSIGGLLLIGQRCRPWMSLPAGVLSVIVGTVLFERQHEVPWWWIPVTNLRYAAVMLYGTWRLERQNASSR